MIVLWFNLERWKTSRCIAYKCKKTTLLCFESFSGAVNKKTCPLAHQLHEVLCAYSVLVYDLIIQMCSGRGLVTHWLEAFNPLSVSSGSHCFVFYDSQSCQNLTDNKLHLAKKTDTINAALCKIKYIPILKSECKFWVEMFHLNIPLHLVQSEKFVQIRMCFHSLKFILVTSRMPTSLLPFKSLKKKNPHMSLSTFWLKSLCLSHLWG